jgi:hypothetical protein
MHTLYSWPMHTLYSWPMHTLYSWPMHTLYSWPMHTLYSWPMHTLYSWPMHTLYSWPMHTLYSWPMHTLGHTTLQYILRSHAAAYIVCPCTLDPTPHSHTLHTRLERSVDHNIKRSEHTSCQCTHLATRRCNTYRGHMQLPTYCVTAYALHMPGLYTAAGPWHGTYRIRRLRTQLANTHTVQLANAHTLPHDVAIHTAEPCSRIHCLSLHIPPNHSRRAAGHGTHRMPASTSFLYAARGFSVDLSVMMGP